MATPDSTATVDYLSPIDIGQCPRCEGYLHPYATTCFGCQHERGHAFAANRDAVALVKTGPLADLLSIGSLAEEIRAEFDPGSATDAEVRAGVYRQLRMVPSEEPEWKIPTQAVNYAGGLESAPHDEYAQLYYREQLITVVGDNSRRVIASIPPSHVLSVTAHGALDEVLGGRTFGVYTGGFASFQTAEPTEGGALQIVFADELGVWRVMVIGNRSGLTDKRYAYEAYNAMAFFTGLLIHWHVVGREWEIGPPDYAASLGLNIPDENDAPPADGPETKTCPDCAETVQAAARICRFCRYEFT